MGCLLILIYLFCCNLEKRQRSVGTIACLIILNVKLKLCQKHKKLIHLYEFAEKSVGVTTMHFERCSTFGVTAENLLHLATLF